MADPKTQHYEITISGRTFSFDGPPGLNQEQARDVVRARMEGGTVGRGAAQVGLGALAGLVEQAPTTLTMGGGPAAEAWRHLVRKAIPSLDRDKGPNAPQGFGENLERTAGEFLGNPATYAGAQGAAGITGRVVDAVMSAVGSEGVRQIMQQAHANPILGGIAQYIAGMVGPVGRNQLAEGIPRFREDPIHDRMVDTLENKYDIHPTAADVRQSKSLRRVETTAGSLPGSFGAAERESERVGAEISNALLRLGGDTTTDMREGNVDFGDALVKVKENAQGRLDNAATNLPIEFNKTLSDSMTSVLRDAQRRRLPQEDIDQIQGMIEIITEGFSERGRKPPQEVQFNFEGQQMPVDMRQGKAQMTGETYQSLTRKTGHLTRLQDSKDSNLSYYGDLLRTALDDAMEHTVEHAAKKARARKIGPGASASQRRAAELENALQDLRTARKQWYTMLITAKAFASGGGEAAHGRMSAQKLRQLVTATQDDKLNYALQRSYLQPDETDLRELARVASGVITNLANSTTSERGYAMHTLEGLGHRIAEVGAKPAVITGATTLGAMGHPFAAAAALFTPGIAGRAVLSKTMQRALKQRRDAASNIPLGTSGVVNATEINADEDQTRKHSPPSSLITPANAGEFKPLDPSHPSYTNPGGHEETPTTGAVGRAWPDQIGKLRKTLREARSWKDAAKAFPGSTPEGIRRAARRYNVQAPNIPNGGYGPASAEELGNRPPSGMEPGWAKGTLDRLDEEKRTIPQIRVTPLHPPDDQSMLAPEQTPEQALENAPSTEG